jgi:hypothetical protein
VDDHVGHHLAGCEANITSDQIVGVPQQHFKPMPSLTAGINLMLESESNVRVTLTIGHAVTLPAIVVRQPFPPQQRPQRDGEALATGNVTRRSLHFGSGEHLPASDEHGG